MHGLFINAIRCFFFFKLRSPNSNLLFLAFFFVSIFEFLLSQYEFYCRSRFSNNDVNNHALIIIENVAAV